jgi:sodium/hydrogen antiporter
MTTNSLIESMTAELWFILAGSLLIGMALLTSKLKRLPLSTSMLYLGLGVGLGPVGWGLIQLDPLVQSVLLERLTEIAVIISLFTAGLKLRTPLSDGRWRLPVRLAFGSMVLTVGMIAIVGVVVLGLPLGAAVLLGAALAPTDPVLASEVQIERPSDDDRLRFGLTGEAGLNDGTAFPFVMLGLGLLGLHDLGDSGWRWLAVDAVWATAGGLVLGGVLGTAVGQVVLYLRRQHQEALGLDDFLALGLIALAYGAALLMHTYGFLAVFAAGLALRRIERQSTSQSSPEAITVMPDPGEDEDIATDPEKAPAYMAQAVLGFNEKLERIGEVLVVVIIGTLLTPRFLPLEMLWFVPLLFLVIRPVAVVIGLMGSHVSALIRPWIAWFGIRGIGSFYYLMYAIEHNLPPDLAGRLMAITFTVIAASIVVHGLSVTPLMKHYEWLKSRS